jgi:[acyl-carrier-protein] S-malonyltransferase
MSLALVFPGQGSQFVGMGKSLAEWSAAAREAFQEADDALGEHLSTLCFEGPEEDLKLTENTQPAILATSVAALRALADQVEMTPAFVAGHSLGEYSALVAAGSISYADALRSVRARGRAMQEAVPAGEGAMAALLNMDREVIEEICREATDDSGLVSPANFNSPGQIVIAGNTANVKRAMELFGERGGRRAVELPVSAPFHCALMQPAASRMEEVLAVIQIDNLKTVLVNNADASPITDGDAVAPSLVRQVTSPVLWEGSVRHMIAQGTSFFLEVGPGKVLAGLGRRIDRESASAVFGTAEDFDAAASFIEENN